MPEPINDVIDELFASASVEAVVVGGSRAIGRERPDSDWDIGVYYRGTVDTRHSPRTARCTRPARGGES